ncbi:hypothetical protein [Glycomyces paridis]|uniref:Uncharacterized protein n=1 Tax=Glycomyces paridis TaxID=2126555 RepID=A0A4S8P989_9ACTN|nr:hypothetical protein [Glycomyces paridis]THV26808.1 hypothetical protein E9998_17640 [Glycomyces paridis]
MQGFDAEIEKAVSRASKAAGWMYALAAVTLIVGIVGAVNTGGIGLIAVLPAVGLLSGLGVIINLLAMHLMETWRQGNHARAADTRQQQ